MCDGRALQAGTSHNLGQNFTRAYEIEFQTKEQGTRENPWQTSWGLSTRIIGAIIMAHGDEAGLVLPPRVAPYPGGDRADRPQGGGARRGAGGGRRDRGGAAADRARQGRRARGADARLQVQRMGAARRAGAHGDRPARPAAGQVVLAGATRAPRRPCPSPSCATRIPALLDEVQRSLYDRALALRQELPCAWTTTPPSPARSPSATCSWRPTTAARRACEATIKEETKATVRCIPFAAPPEDGPCVRCDAPGIGKRVIFAKAY